MSLGWFGIVDGKKKKETPKKTKLPTQYRTPPDVYCRNCNTRNPYRRKICLQCDIELKNPMRRPYK